MTTLIAARLSRKSISTSGTGGRAITTTGGGATTIMAGSRRRARSKRRAGMASGWDWHRDPIQPNTISDGEGSRRKERFRMVKPPRDPRFKSL
jgi:hypothetical protein